eukprot:symbB.v1.2.023746.t1/scaffold1947.1/size119105/4
MLWHLHQQLAPNELGQPLQISIATKEAQLQALTSTHEVVVVANLATATVKTVESFRAAVQQLVWKKEVPSDIPVPLETKSSTSKKAARKQRQKRQRARVLFVALTQDAADASVPRGKVAAFVGGKAMTPTELEKDWTNASNIGKIKEVTLSAVSSLPQEGRVQPTSKVYLQSRLLTAQRPVSPIGRRNALKELQEVPSANSWRGSQGVPRSLWPTSSCTFTAFSQDNEKLSLYDTMEGIYTELWQAMACVFTLKDVAAPVELLQVAECGVPETVSLDRSAEIDLSHEFPPEQREAQIDQAWN